MKPQNSDFNTYAFTFYRIIKFISFLSLFENVIRSLILGLSIACRRFWNSQKAELARLTSWKYVTEMLVNKNVIG